MSASNSIYAVSVAVLAVVLGSCGGGPAGLSLNSSTGVVSGTPRAVSALASYTVTASNSGGSTTAAIAIVVNLSGSGIAYNSSYYSFTKDVPSATITPTGTGGAVSSWSVQPALPAGLTLDATTGAISGTPTVGAAAATYNITATNGGDQQAISLTLAVAGAPLLDVGHSGQIIYARLVGSALLTQDGSQHWVLWNHATGQNVASGQASQVEGNTP